MTGAIAHLFKIPCTAVHVDIDAAHLHVEGAST